MSAAPEKAQSAPMSARTGASGWARNFFGRGPRRLAQLRRRKSRGNEEGSALVEIALTLPVLITFFFGLIEVSLAFYTHQVLSESAREGTRYAIVHGSTCTTGSGSACTVSAATVNSYVSGLSWPNFGSSAMSVNTTYPDGNEAPGSRVQVTITYGFPFRVPFIPTSTLTMSSSSVMYIVQ
jgi:Flp pilus assembly protein TadG